MYFSDFKQARMCRATEKVEFGVQVLRYMEISFFLINNGWYIPFLLQNNHIWDGRCFSLAVFFHLITQTNNCLSKPNDCTLYWLCNIQWIYKKYTRVLLTSLAVHCNESIRIRMQFDLPWRQFNEIAIPHGLLSVLNG